MSESLAFVPGLDRLFKHEKRDGLLCYEIRAGESRDAGGVVSTDFVASTAAVDRMGDIVDQGTWRLANFRKNPVILYEHAAPVVGRGEARVNREGAQLEVRVTWDIGDHNPIGTLAGMQHLNGFRSAGSVGFIPGKAINRADLDEGDERRAPKGTPRYAAGHVFKHNELLEFSSVAVPANPQALHLQGFALEVEDPDEQIRRFVSESVDSKLRGFILDAVRADEEIRRAIRGMVWGEPAPAPEPDPVPTTPGFPVGFFNTED